MMADTNAREAPLSMKSAEKSAPAAGPDAADRLITKPIPLIESDDYDLGEFGKFVFSTWYMEIIEAREQGQYP